MNLKIRKTAQAIKTYRRTPKDQLQFPAKIIARRAKNNKIGSIV